MLCKRVSIAFLAVVLFVEFGAAHGAGPPEIPGLLSYSAPAFPVTLKASDISDGYATIAFTLGSDGHIDDAVVLEASHPAFGDAVKQELPAWILETASKDTIPRREVVQFDFRRNGVVGTMSHFDAAKSAFATTTGVQIKSVSRSRLDKPVQPLVTVKPSVPKSLGRQIAGSSVAVNFVIDEQGHVRVPVVPAAVESQSATAILKAVKQWQFSPPTHEGRPVVVEMTHLFSFAASPSAP